MTTIDLTYTGSDGTELSAWNSGFRRMTQTSGAVMQINSNGAVPANGNGSYPNAYCWTGASFANDQKSWGYIRAISSRKIGVCVRGSATQERYYALLSESSYGTREVVRNIDGTFTQLASVGTAYSVNDKIELRAEGYSPSVTLSIYRNDVLDTGFGGGTGVITDSNASRLQSGSPGIASVGGSNLSRIDDTRFEDIVPPPTPPIGAQLSMARANDAIVCGRARMM